MPSSYGSYAIFAALGVLLLLLLLVVWRISKGKRRAPVVTPEAERPGLKLVPPEAAPEGAVPAEAPVPAEKPKTLREGLSKTRGGFIARIGDLLGQKKIDEALIGQLEEILFTADIGARTAEKLLEAVRTRLSRAELKDAGSVWEAIRERSREIFSDAEKTGGPFDLERARPLVILMIGVNGVGKTTTIGKLAHRFGGAGKKVLLAAGDTFRAAATEQLEIWGQRTGVPVQRGKEGGDPSSVVFDAVKRAEREGFDLVLADTAGRLHTKTELMQELQKVRRVTDKALPGAPHETLLVLDATNGQNAIQQATLFKEAMQVTGIVLTKLDGTAKGGVVLGICDELKIPVRFVGIGEKPGDLRPFDPEEFVAALFGGDR
jgi:fused signal recognition particle receptor